MGSCLFSFKRWCSLLQKENKILFILILGMMMGAIDTTIVLLALPSIVNSLHGSLSLSIWVIVIYLLIVSVATTQLGRLGDLFGRSRLFNIGFVVFIVGSALCGFAPNLLFLIGSRAVQAVGGSLLEANRYSLGRCFHKKNGCFRL